MADEIRIRTATETDAQAWDAYVVGHAHGSFFHRYGWKRLIENTYRYPGHYLLAERNGSLCGVLPLGEVKHLLFGHSLISVPFCVYGGVLADDDTIRGRLESEAMALAERLGVSHLETRNEHPMRDDWQRKDGLYVTFKREISDDHDANMNAIPRKQRAMVRKGIKAGLVGELDDGIEHLYRAYSESVRNLGTPVFPRSLFDATLDSFGDEADILTVRHQGTPVASVLSLYHRGAVMPYWGGGTGLARPLRANDRMYYELMLHARRRGCARFDFGRSKTGSGAYNFKRNWGFEPEPLTYASWTAPGAEQRDTDPTSAKHSLKIAIWRRLPLALANRLGPMISRGLG